MINAEKFPTLAVWDGGTADGATHMAADEALIRVAERPVLRGYRWKRPEISFGYPLRWREVEPLAQGRPAVRRWTGGGIVEHGSDLTIALAVPATFRPGAPTLFYERIHRAIVTALESPAAELAGKGGGGRECFASPVCHDVLLDGRKVAGGAIRRCREGVLYQGSIQCPSLPAHFIAKLAALLSDSVFDWTPSSDVSSISHRLLVERYATKDWLEKR